MFDRNTKSALAVALLLSATPLVGSVASAQDAIMLEQFGAVRMAQPEEARRATGTQTAADQQKQNLQDHEDRGTSR